MNGDADIAVLFLQRYDALYGFWLGDIWTRVPGEAMRRRPHPQVNSIAWIMWHLTRAEDAGMNRFVTDGTQVLDEGEWMRAMNLPWRHNGGGMPATEVDELNHRVDLSALHGYSNAVQARTREVIGRLGEIDLHETLEAERLRRILVDEGLAHPAADGLLQHYLGWSKGKCLMLFGLTHPFQHAGQISIIAKLLGVSLE